MDKYQYGVKYTYVYPEDVGVEPFTSVMALENHESADKVFDYVISNKNAKDVKIVKRKVGEWEDA
jgi:hypothetical protein